METGFLNFHDEEHFSDFSLSLEQNLMEKPQDLLMHIVENDFDYMETHLDIANSDSLWSNEHEHNEDMGELPISDISAVPKIDNIKEDFAKVLTDWQEHIGYLQASDMDEYMDIIGLSMNGNDKKNFYAPENMLQDEPPMQITESDFLMAEHDDVKKHDLEINQSIPKLHDCSTHIDNVMQENIFHKVDSMPEENDEKTETESGINDVVHKEPTDSQTEDILNKSTQKHESKGIDVTAKVSTKPKKKKKGKTSQRKQVTENHDCVDVETISDELPVLQAGDVKSLLEQFEASENTAMSSPPVTKPSIDTNQTTRTKSVTTRQATNQPQSVAKKSGSQVSNLHKNIRDSLPKEVIDRIKASGRKRVISVIPAMPNTQSVGRTSGTRMQDAAVTLSRNKLLKIVTNNTKTRTVDGGLVQLDHDYCTSASSSISSSDSNSEYERQSSDSEKTTPVKDDGSRQSRYAAYIKQTSTPQSTLCKNSTKTGELWTEGSSKKDSGLESGELSDASEEQQGGNLLNGVPITEPTKQLQSEVKDSQKEIPVDQSSSQPSCSSNSLSNHSMQVQNESPNKPSPIHEMKIRSALATSILQLRQGVLTKTKTMKAGGHRMKQMVSVLKKPLNVSQPPVLTTNPNESIVTTTNSSNDEVQNIIIQNTQDEPIQEEEKKPPRRKLNLAEYRSRREQNRSDNSRTNSPIQPMTLVYVHHASTTTEPIKDDPNNLIWSEREIVSVLKPKVDIDEEKVRPKPTTCDIGIQTYETVFEFPTRSLVDIDERNEEQRDKQIRDRKQRPYRKQRVTSSSSRSRSRSKSPSRSRSGSRSRSRSRSRRRSNTRRRRISHRRSSVSSSSSWSSRSRSHTRSTSSSRSRYSRSRSRSSRSRSRSSSRYSSCSRSSSRSNFGRSKWSSRRRRGRRDRRRSYDRHRRRSSGSYRGYRDWRRSPSSSYRKPYDNWYDREKQRQVEERRVIYVGRLDEGITKADLRRRFEVFGPVVDISVHFREHGDNYGFVTFAYKNDAYEAVEHGNDDPSLPRYDLCFGGRRAFCKVKYADLDGMASSSPGSGHVPQMNEDNTFDLLLKEAKAKLRKRKV